MYDVFKVAPNALNDSIKHNNIRTSSIIYAWVIATIASGIVTILAIVGIRSVSNVLPITLLIETNILKLLNIAIRVRDEQIIIAGRVDVIINCDKIEVFPRASKPVIKNEINVAKKLFLRNIA